MASLLRVSSFSEKGHCHGSVVERHQWPGRRPAFLTGIHIKRRLILGSERDRAIWLAGETNLRLGDIFGDIFGGAKDKRDLKTTGAFCLYA